MITNRHITWPLLICGITLILITGFRIHVPGHDGMVPDTFWKMKQNWKSCADVVVAGDSRIYRGISPQAMASFLPDRRILNFGFSACGFSRPYLEAAVKVLDPDSPDPIIVLGITPYSLTPDALEQNQFIGSRQKNNRSFDRLNRFLYFFRPLDRDDIAFIFSLFPVISPRSGWYEKIPKIYYNTYYPDGWVASGKIPEEPEAALSSYGRVFAENAVSGAAVQDLSAWIREMKDSGIRVFAFRVPSSEKMVALENRLGEFNEIHVREAVTCAGGIWLEMDQTRYHSYDGSHLRKDAAVALSEDISKKIADRMGFRQKGWQSDTE